MSDSWIEQYSAALDVRDAREQAHKPYIDAYTKLADRTASLEANPPPVPPSAEPTQTPGKERTGAPSKGKATANDPSPSANDILSTIRADLATTQKARTALQAQVTEVTTSLSALQLQAKASSTEVSQLRKQKLDLERKLRDRDEELRGKAGLVERAQDEMVALGLQLNMSEQRKEALEKENKELVDRWMKRMEEEADRVNRDSRWG